MKYLLLRTTLAVNVLYKLKDGSKQRQRQYDKVIIITKPNVNCYDLT